MRRLSIAFIFVLAIAIYCQQATQITPVNGASYIAVVDPTEFSNKAVDSQLLTANDDADEIADLPLVESGMTLDDLFAFFPPTISKAVLHMAHPKPPEILRL